MKKKIIRITTIPLSLKVLLKGQLRYMSDFFDIKAVSSPGKLLDEVKEDEGVEVIPLKMSRKITPFSDFISLIKLIFILRKEKPDIVHTHTPKAGLLGMLAAKITRVPVRMHTVAGMPLMVAEGFKKKLLVFIEKLTYACATNVYPNSSNLKKYIIENGFCKSDKLDIIGKGSSNGIDTEYFKITEELREKADELHKKFKLPENAFVFLFVGRIVRDKGINELVNAFKKLNYENVFLILVGDFEMDLDPVDENVLNEIENNDKILTPGFQSDVRPWFVLSDIFVFPSYREGFPNVVMQAGAMEVPAIVSDINGCNEIIQNGKNGIIVKVKNKNDLFNAINKVFNNDDLLKYMKTYCRKNITENYERKYIWKQLHNEYDRLLSDV